jgi:uncharacterized membrane protein (DUF2068 family)
MPKKEGRDRWITVIAILKLIKGVMLFFLALGVFKLVRGDLETNLENFAGYLNIDPNNHYFQKIFSKMTNMSPNTIKAWGIGTFFYSLLFLIEGVGLLLQKRWAEYFTVFVTGSFVPLEVYELIKKFSAIKVLVLISNVAIVFYLVWKLRHSKKGSPR